MIKKETHTCSPSRFIALTSLRLPEFMLLLVEFAPLWRAHSQRYDLHGNLRKIPKFSEDQRCSLQGDEEKLFFILRYLKTNPLQEDYGSTYDMSQGKVSQWVKVLTELVREALARMKQLPARCADKLYAVLLTLVRCVLFIDATERGVPRPDDYECQKELYSGKKGRHTVKNNLLADEHNRILFLSETWEGKAHDKKIADESRCYFPEGTALFQDLGYLGLEIENVVAMIPFKKPRGGELTPAQKDFNQKLAGLRVRIEHVMSGVKRLRIVKEIIRLKGEEIRDKVMEIACGLHNLRVEQRRKIPND